MKHQFTRNGSHYNGGAVFFGYGYTAVGEPRLSMVRKFFKRGSMSGKVEDSYYVDGAPVGTYEDAVAALKKPPTFTAEEVAALARIGNTPADHRDDVPWIMRWTLHAKGAIAYEGPPGHCRLTDAGRQALPAIQS